MPKKGQTPPGLAAWKAKHPAKAKAVAKKGGRKSPTSKKK